jgi:hypothetical protein
VNNTVAFFYPGESSSTVRTPQMLDSADEVSGDYSHQCETVGESNSQNLEVSIPLSRLRGGR